MEDVVEEEDGNEVEEGNGEDEFPEDVVVEVWLRRNAFILFLKSKSHRTTFKSLRLCIRDLRHSSI